VDQCHVEITTLIVPGLNDDRYELKNLAVWLAGISQDIPLHLSRYFPNYKMKVPATSHSTMKMAYEIAKEHLRYVYLGNMGSHEANTYCPVCGKLVIDRLKGKSNLSENKKCSQCGSTVSLVGEVCF
jgi:pyruvate formate lyase activating enzyme